MAGTAPGDRHFVISREGKDIGRHDVTFRPTDRGLEVATDIGIMVKVAFITAFRFEQQARDLWVDGQLVQSRVRTDDNGKISETVIQPEAGKLSVEGGVSGRQLLVPMGTMTDIAFWNLDIVRQRALVDIQKAQLTDVAAQPAGSENIEIDGSLIEAHRYRIAAESGRNGDIWFDHTGNWVKGLLVTRGETLDYRLTA
jgi:hypothetical protein